MTRDVFDAFERLAGAFDGTRLLLRRGVLRVTLAGEPLLELRGLDRGAFFGARGGRWSFSRIRATVPPEAR